MQAVPINEFWRQNYDTIIIILYIGLLLSYNFYIKASYQNFGVISLACRQSRKIIANNSSKRIQMIEN